MKKILLLLSLLICTLSYAQDWKLIFEADDVAYYYKPNTENTAWIKSVSDKTEYYPTRTSKTSKYVDGYRLTLWKFDCYSKQIGLIQVNVYSKEGKLMSKMSEQEYLVDLEYVTPDSIGEGFYSAFCLKEE